LVQSADAPRSGTASRRSNITRANFVRVGMRAILVLFSQKPAPQRRSDAPDFSGWLFPHGAIARLIER
jgi:hypothetical protein